MRVTTPPITGTNGDTVVASLVDTGVRTGASVTVTLRLLDSSGATVVQVTGAVSEGAPLRLSSYEAPSTAGLSAQVDIPLGPTRLSAPVVTLERWNPLTLVGQSPVVCQVPLPEPTPPPGPLL